VLKLFGVGIPSLQVAGGLMIMLISLSMLQSSQSAIHDTKNNEEKAALQRPTFGGFNRLIKEWRKEHGRLQNN
jgi:small neutral amino acid transporter SnatA (MarC family)